MHFTDWLQWDLRAGTGTVALVNPHPYPGDAFDPLLPDSPPHDLQSPNISLAGAFCATLVVYVGGKAGGRERRMCLLRFL